MNAELGSIISLVCGWVVGAIKIAMRFQEHQSKLEAQDARITKLESVNALVFAKLDKVVESLARIEGKLGVTAQ